MNLKRIHPTHDIRRCDTRRGPFEFVLAAALAMAGVTPAFERCVVWLLLTTLAATACLSGSRANAQEGVLNDIIEFSTLELHLVPYAQVPPAASDKRIISMTSQRPDDDLLYAVTQRGRIYSVAPNGDNTGDIGLWFDMLGALNDVPGVSFNPDGAQRALQEVAFHPEFANPNSPGYGKFYTSFVAEKPSDTSGANYVGSSVPDVGIDEESVLSEWTFDFETGTTPTSSYRELFRVNLIRYDHPIKGVRFNPFAVPGDSDYGLLYIGHGDGSQGNPLPIGGGLNNDDALGKILRIDPLQDGDEPYSVRSNLFAEDGDPNTLAEVFSTGQRNPHNMSFNQDDEGNVVLAVGNIGGMHIEELNLIKIDGGFGGNFGWSDREGTFVNTFPNVDELPADEWALNDYIYPAAQFDHDLGGGTAIASSFAIRNGSNPALHNEFIITNFAAQDGKFYHAQWEDLLGAHTQLADGESPDELTQAVLQQLRIYFDDDNDPDTPPIVFEDFKDLIGAARTDTRFGRGQRGEMYISSKQNGMIYLVTNSLPEEILPGDFNYSGVVDAADLMNVWAQAFGVNDFADADDDGDSDGSDFLAWQRNFGKTHNVAASLEAAIPEPTSLNVAVFAIAAVGAARLRRLLTIAVTIQRR